MARAERIAGWMRERAAAAGARGFVIGLSGGVDSAVAARLAQLAAPGAVVGVVMPCHSDPADERDAMLLASHFSLPAIRVDLAAAHNPLIELLKSALLGLPSSIQPMKAPNDLTARVSLANVKPRLRMATLYFIANRLNYLVVGTGNRSELSIGYFTKYGDGGVDVLPLAHLVKSQVRALAKELGVPIEIIERTPSAGLWLGQTDEGEMGFTYAELDQYLSSGPEAVAPSLAVKIERLVRASEHKRHPPPSPPAD